MIRLQYLSPHALRVTHAGADQQIPADRPWFAHVFLPQPAWSSDAQSLVGDVDHGVVIRRSDGTELIRELQPPLVRDQQVQLQFRLEPGEGWYGGGAWFNAFRRSVGHIRLDTRESQAQNQHKQTYSNLPVFLSSRGYALVLLNSHRSRWQLDPQAGRVVISADGPPVDYLIINGPGFADLVRHYTALTGRPPLPPRWAFGLWVTGYPQEPQHVVEQRVDQHRARALPLDGVILDYHWEAGFHTFQWRKALFPDPDRLIRQLKQAGVKLGLILTPFVNHKNNLGWRYLLYLLFRNVSGGQLHADERDRQGYDHALRHGYLAHPDTWWWLGGGGMIDFSNPEAAAWWNQRMAPRYHQGVALFKNDDGEYLPDDATSALGMTGREYHNIYGFFYGRAIYQGMEQLDDRRAMIYARSVWIGSQRYPALFLGDQKPTFEHIKATMRAGLNLSLLGFSYWTPDVFGLDGATNEETHIRYAQWALLAPVARYFWRPPAIDATRFPWSHGVVAEANFRAYTTLRYRLLPYWWELAWEAMETGLPIMRPLLLVFDDPAVADLADQVMLGERLLLAPVVEAGATQRAIYLPPGIWHDFWSTTEYQGGQTIQYPAPLDRLPLLVRGGSLIPFGPALSSIAEDHCFDQLELHSWPPYPAHCRIYDDDGQSRQYRRGNYAISEVEMMQQAHIITVNIRPRVGDLQVPPQQRCVTLVLHQINTPTSVLANDQPIPWQYQPQTRELRVDVCYATHEGVRLIIQ